MGMFDSFYDSDDREWQTKAYSNMMSAYRVGDTLPELEDHPDVTEYQVEILCGIAYPVRKHIDSFATVIGNKLTSIHDSRNLNLPRISYYGYKYDPEAEQALEARPEAL